MYGFGSVWVNMFDYKHLCPGGEASPCAKITHEVGSMYYPAGPPYILHNTDFRKVLYYALYSMYTLHSALYTLHCTLYTLHSALCTLHSALCTLYSTLHSTLYTIHYAGDAVVLTSLYHAGDAVVVGSDEACVRR
jgi:hypothetical protein